MANNVDLTAAIALLVQAINGMPRAAAPPPQVFDPFASDAAFDLSTRSGSTAYATISAPLDEIWNGDTSTFPSFVVSLRIRAKEGKWDAAGTTDAVTGITTPNPTNILDVGGRNILTDYHSISDADVLAATTSPLNDRKIQNFKAMFSCIKSSIEGDIKDTIFTQFGDLPSHDNGVSLFKRITSFTSVSSLQLSMLSFNNILTFNPHDFKYNIPIINKKLVHYFVLSTTSSRTLLDAEKIQHLLTVYGKILQPESWAQWVRNKLDDFEDGNIIDCQDFMNKAVIKYNKIVCVSGNFSGSITTVQEDIIAMIATKQKTNKRKSSSDDDADTKPSKFSKFSKTTKRDPPPFVTHFKSSEGVKYKLADKRVHDGATFYFCDCPLHLNKLKWHTHHPDKCRIRSRWLKEKDSTTNSTSEDASANISEENGAYDTTTSASTDDTATTDASVPTQDAQALLANAINLVTDNDVAKDLMLDALNAFSNM